MGADWIGLNFHPGSPRYVEQSIAAAIIAALPDTVAVVGVFVDRPPGEVAEVAERLGLGIVQLHGQEPPEDLLELGPLRVIRAFRLGHPSAWNGVCDYVAQADALGRPLDGVLVDAYVAGQPGGTGVSIRDDILDCRPPLPRLVPPGGADFDAAECGRSSCGRIRPWMVDVASGVESAPGRKDPDSVAAFIRAARSADRARDDAVPPA